MQSVAYSPDGRYIISGCGNGKIRIWDTQTGAAVGNPVEGHTRQVQSVAYSPAGRQIISGFNHNTTYVSEPSPPEPFSSCNPPNVHFFSQPDSRGWIRDSHGGLLYWVPPDCRSGLHSPGPMTIPVRFDHRPVSLDFGDFAFGSAWTQIFNSAQV